MARLCYACALLCCPALVLYSNRRNPISYFFVDFLEKRFIIWRAWDTHGGCHGSPTAAVLLFCKAAAAISSDFCLVKSFCLMLESMKGDFQILV